MKKQNELFLKYLNTQHLIAVEDKSINCLVESLIKKLNNNYVIKENVDNDRDKCVYFDNKCVCDLYLLNGKNYINQLPNVPYFDNLKSLLLILDKDASAEIEGFKKKINEKNNLDLKNFDFCLIPSESQDGDEIEDYVCSKLKGKNKEKINEIGEFLGSFICKFHKSRLNSVTKYGKRKLSILLYIESKNLRNVEQDKHKYIRQIVDNIDEQEEIFIKIKDYFDRILEGDND
ncbi:hypothetical protein V4762_04160 [Thermodesulfobium sp. 4217-1]|uniref:hypothetical protein n=1 Tax=Thermodesulfobium sp. 4217-1 TaxID=3120013 RepID=UPI0032217B10